MCCGRSPSRMCRADGYKIVFVDNEDFLKELEEKKE
jgi:hypothetical protein